jgi:hypothetical protein
VELRTILVADYANIAEGGKPNVMGIFREIYAQEFPARHSDMYLVVALLASPAEFGQRRMITTKLINADATETLMEFSQPITVPTATSGRSAEINSILRLRDITFKDPGTYQFSVLVDNDEKGTLAIEVNKIERQQS